MLVSTKYERLSEEAKQPMNGNLVRYRDWALQRVALPVVAILTGIGMDSCPAAAAVVSTSPAPQLSVSAIYTNMTVAMRKQPSPHDVIYDETFTPHGLGIRIVDAEHGASIAQLVFSSDMSPRTFHVRLSESGQTGVYDLTTGKHFSALRMFWAATWQNVHPSSTNPSVPGEQRAATSGVNGARDRLIADVIVMSDLYYKVWGGEVESLDKVPVYHLHLSARSDNNAHPLTDLYVDTSSFLVLKAVAAFKNEAMISGDTGTIALKFGRVGAFWMVTSGEVSARAHVFFTHVMGTASFVVSNVTFPAL